MTRKDIVQKAIDMMEDNLQTELSNVALKYMCNALYYARTGVTSREQLITTLSDKTFDALTESEIMHWTTEIAIRRDRYVGEEFPELYNYMVYSWQKGDIWSKGIMDGVVLNLNYIKDRDSAVKNRILILKHLKERV